MDNEFPLGEMIMIPESEYDLLERDLEYWVTATTMLSSILAANNIDHEVNEDTVEEYLESLNHDT